MAQMIHRTLRQSRVVLALLGLLFLTVCTSTTQITGYPVPGEDYSPPPQETATPYPAPRKSTPYPTRPVRMITPVIRETRFIPTMKPLSMNLADHGRVYDAKATPQFPIRQSVSWPIWGTAIPARPIKGKPKFIDHPIPKGLATADPAALTEAGCKRYDMSVDCDLSRLGNFGCTDINYPDQVYFQPQPDLELVATCLTRTDGSESSAEDAVYLKGCPSTPYQQVDLDQVGFFFKTGEEYLLINKFEDLRDQFSPIKSAAEAISYAQLATGLRAYFRPLFDTDFSYDRLYLQKKIDETRAVKTWNGYRVNLFHIPECICSDIFSEVIIEVRRDGSIEWVSAKPVAIQTFRSCDI